MTQSPSYVSEPQVVDLPKLLSDVRGGHIQVPRFQRPFVWDDERRVELLRSLRAGIPVGSLLVWRTSQNQLRCFDRLAGVNIPQPVPGQTVSYLLDGHQRLTTLFAAFAPPDGREARPGVPSEDDAPEPIYFDLAQDDFVVGNPRREWSCLPLHLLLDAVGLRRYFREAEKAQDVEPDRLDAYQTLAEKVLYAMQWCRIPVVPLSTESLELATRTFHRVNSQGVPMTEVHMVAALTWGDNYDLREAFQSTWAQEDLPPGWEPTDEQQTLNVVKGLLGMDLSRAPGDLLVNRIRQRHEKNDRIAERSVQFLVQAMRLASTHCVHTPALIPYQLQLTLTAIALGSLAEGQVPDTELLRRWWGLTTVWASFSGASTSRVQAALKHLRAGLSGQPVPWPDQLYSSPFLPSLPALELRNARARYFLDGYAQACGKVPLLHERKTRALVSVVQGRGAEAGVRFLWESEHMRTLTDALGRGDTDALRGHFVDGECLRAWQAGDVDGFVRTRQQLMDAQDRVWFVGLRPQDMLAGR